MKTKHQTAHLVSPVPTKTLPPAPTKPEVLRSRLLERDARGKNTHAYTKAGDTDVAALFKRIARQQKEAGREAEAAAQLHTVAQIKRKVA